jgi:addiction module RelE/StbE family toxin
MKIRRKKKFIKNYHKLSTDQQKKVDQAIARFVNDPFDPALNNHPLHGRFKDLRSISAGWDLRIIFQESGGYIIVVFLQVGTHSQVY